jgi:hypothetical protein
MYDAPGSRLAAHDHRRSKELGGFALLSRNSELNRLALDHNRELRTQQA